MEKLIFVESSFQEKLAKEIAGPKNIIYIEKSLLVRLRQIPGILGLILKGSDIYIGDHRNFIYIFDPHAETKQHVQQNATMVYAIVWITF